MANDWLIIALLVVAVLIFFDIVVVALWKYDGPWRERIQKKWQSEKMDFYMGLSKWPQWREKVWGWRNVWKKEKEEA